MESAKMATLASNHKPVQALFNAVSASKLRLVRLLIEGGVHVDTRNDHGRTPLLITCSSLNNTYHIREETRENVVKYLIAAGADVNAHDVTGRTPLIYAVITRAESPVIFELVDAGAHIWLEDNSHKCAFDYAIQQEDIGQVEVIVDAYKRRRMRQLELADGPRAMDFDDASKRPPQRRKKSRCKTAKSKHGESGKKPKVHPDSHRRSARHVILVGSNGSDASPQNHKHTNMSQATHANPISEKNRSVIKSLIKNPLAMTKSLPYHTYDPEEYTNNPDHPEATRMSRVEGRGQLCDLCNSILGDHNAPEPPEESSEHLKMTENTDLYRRRSTGSIFGLLKKQYGAIRKKRELGISVDDLFSSKDTSAPMKHLYGETPQTDDLLDISSNELLVPDSNCVRSKSVCLPLLDDATHMLEEHLNMFGTREQHVGKCFLTSAMSVPQLHSPDSCSYAGSDDDWDEDMLNIPPCRSMTSSPDGDSWSQRDLMSPQSPRKSPSMESVNLSARS